MRFYKPENLSMKSRIFKPVFILITLSFLCLIIFAFSIFSNNSGYFRRYLDSDIPFIYELNDTTPPDFFGPIIAGTQSWEDLKSSYWEFEYGGITSINSDGLDGTNLVFFDFQGVNFSPGTNTIAYSRTWTSGSGSNYHATESDMVWNARDYPPSTVGAAGAQDLQSVITHEFGHHLGLGHAGPAGGPPGVGPLLIAATMYGFATSGDTTKRSLHIDDIAGISAIYPTWIIEGNVTDVMTGLAFSGAQISSEEIFGSIIGPIVFDPNSGRYQYPGFYIDSLSTDQSGNYSVIALKQNFNLSASYYGYETHTVYISLNNPAGIGQTQTHIQDFQIQPSPLSFISGTVVDSLTSAPVISRIKIFASGNKPGASGSIVVDTTTNSNGEFNVSLPAIEDYLILAHPVSPYAEKIYTIDSLSQSGGVAQFEVNKAKVLLVDGDGGNNYEQFYFDDLESQSISYHHWDIQLEGIPTSQIRNGFTNNIVIWFTGDSSSIPLTNAEQNEILDHINMGGNLFLSGQDIAEMTTGSALLDTLGIEFNQNSTLSLIKGVVGDEIGGGLIFNTSGYGGANNQTSSDILQVIDSLQTATIFHYGSGNSKPAGIKFESVTDSSKVVFLGFGYESINDPQRRQTFLSRIMDYFDGTVTNVDGEAEKYLLPEKFDLFQNYPNPFNPVTSIEYNVARKSTILIRIYNILGQKIKTLVNENVQTGRYKVSWDGLDDTGRKVSAGIYFYQLSTEFGFTKTKKLLLLK